MAWREEEQEICAERGKRRNGRRKISGGSLFDPEYGYTNGGYYQGVFIATAHLSD